jgi:urea transport system ATP-binding protein
MSSNTDFVLAVEGLTVSFDGFKAVNDLTFYVDENEIRVIIGPNGAGKTTVLDLICGRTKATDGSIKFRNRELTRMKEHDIVKAGVGRKFQTPSIYGDLSVFENLEISFPRGRSVFGALVFKRDEEVISKVHEVANMIFLGDQLDKQAELLSHGQKQWLEIGMLLMQDPDLLMLDEPVAGMSVGERQQTAELLRSIIKDRSVIVIEHDSVDKVKNDPKVIEVYLGH